MIQSAFKLIANNDMMIVITTIFSVMDNYKFYIVRFLSLRRLQIASVKVSKNNVTSKGCKLQYKYKYLEFLIATINGIKGDHSL